MKLRTIIFVILLALGILPILTLIGVNLTDHIEKHEEVEAKRTIAKAESDFITLNAHIASLKKSLIQAATTPDTVSQATGHSMSLLSDHAHRGLGEILIGLLEPEKNIIDVQILDLNGDEKVHLSRDQFGKFQSNPPDKLRNMQDSPVFWKGLQLAEYEVDTYAHPHPPNPALIHLGLVTPIIGPGKKTIALVIIEVDSSLFLSAHINSFWLSSNGKIINTPLSLVRHKDQTPDLRIGSNLLQNFPDLKKKIEKQLPFVWETDPETRFTMLPVIFNEKLPPTMWVATPVDRSAAQEWKLSLIYNIVWIVFIMILGISFIANAIAYKIDRIKESILTGLDRILNKEEEDVHFSWSGPQEVENLADELTTLARHFTMTRKKQKGAEAALRESEDKFRNLTASAQDAIAMMDHHGDISYWNAAAAEIFGYSEAEALGKPIHALISPRLSEASQKESAEPKPVSDGPIRETIELITRHKNGSEIPIELSLSEARINDQWNSVWIVRDITERKRAEEETKLQQQQLIQADKMISLGVLISGVAHEINNPNSIAMLNTSMLCKAWESAKPILEEYYEENGDFLIAGLEYSEMRMQIPRLFIELEESAKRIKNIVHDLKDYARQDTARHMEKVDLNEVARAAVRLNHNKIKKATKQFSAALAPDLPPIKGNRQRLEQVLINLIQNSCEALTGQEDGITLTTSFDPEKKEVACSVHDTGTGIAPEIMNQIMDPFFTTKRTLGGTGLGLSVSAGIIKEHGGRLHFASTPEEGTTATVTFPFYLEGEEAAGAAAKVDDKAA